jgi:hypothetical protein
MLDHKRCDLGNIDHLVAMRVWILTAESFTATAAGGGNMGNDLLALLAREEVAAGSRMPFLATTLAAGGLALLFSRRLKTVAITGGRLGGVPGATALLLLQLGDTGQELLDQRSHPRWCRLPLMISNAGRWEWHLEWSLSEM